MGDADHTRWGYTAAGTICDVQRLDINKLMLEMNAEEWIARGEQMEDYLACALFLQEVCKRAPDGPWVERAACRGHSDVMFTLRGESTDPAKALCATCPVVEDCLAWGDTLDSTASGIIGGLSGRERRRRRQVMLGDAA